MRRPSTANPIGTLNQNSITLAEDCAHLLWRGVSYTKPNAHQTADADFMQIFAKPVFDFLQGHRSCISYNTQDIRDFMGVAGLTPLLMRFNTLDFSGFQNYLETHIPNQLSTQPINYYHMADIIKGAGKVLAATPKTHRNSGYQIALASRILFFAVPQLPVFNYSNPMSKFLQLKCLPQNIIHEYYGLMDDGFRANINNLKKHTQPPTFKTIGSIQNSQTKMFQKWWYRRVFDLALRITGTTVAPLNPLPPRPTP